MQLLIIEGSNSAYKNPNKLKLLNIYTDVLGNISSFNSSI